MNLRLIFFRRFGNFYLQFGVDCVKSRVKLTLDFVKLIGGFAVFEHFVRVSVNAVDCNVAFRILQIFNRHVSSERRQNGLDLSLIQSVVVDFFDIRQRISGNVDCTAGSSVRLVHCAVVSRIKVFAAQNAFEIIRAVNAVGGNAYRFVIG